MKFCFTALMLASASLASAQITITQAHMPKAKDTLRYSTASAAGVDPEPANRGANRTWDFSSLTATGQDIYKYVAANTTPYAFYFFNQIGQKTADSLGAGPLVFKNLYSFYTSNSSTFKAEGLGYSYSGIPLAANYTDDDEIYQFPLNYGDSDVSTFKFKFAIPGQTTFSFLQAGTRTNVVDGWGSITTPYKTYPSVIRVRTFVDEVDSLITQIAKVPIPRKQMIYRWLSADERVPVLEITGTMVAGNFVANQVRFRDKYNGLQSPFRPRASFVVDKTSGFVNADTFSFTDRSTLGQGYTWQITPNTDIKYVNGTNNKSRNPRVVFGQRGLYTVSLVVSNPFGADDTTAVDLINIAYGVGTSVMQLKGADLYPNPAKDHFSYRCAFPVKSTIQGFDGRQKNLILMPGRPIDISKFSPGVYIVKPENAPAQVLIKE